MKRRTFITGGLVVPAVWAATASVYSGSLHKSDHAVHVINAGIGGNNTIDLLARIDKDCLSQQPDLVIFMAGTNDMNSQKFVPLPDYKKNMQQMIGRMKKSNAAVVLMNLLPVYEPYLFTRHKRDFYEPEGHGGRLLQMNECIARLAIDNNAVLINLYRVFNRVGDIGTGLLSLIKNEANSKSTDGVHPTADGYRVMAVAVHAQLVCSQLNNKKNIVCFGDSITKGDGVEGGENYPSYLQKLLT